MNPIDRLIAADRETKKRICVCGDSLRDVWIHGDLLPSQDGVQKFVERRRIETPGGAAGAARQLCRWNADTHLLSVVSGNVGEAWNQVFISAAEYIFARRIPEKHRFLDAQGRILWRHDVENGYGADANLMEKWRATTMDRLKRLAPDAVLIADYDKGFLTEPMIRQVIEWCNGWGVPVVADAKREPMVYGRATVIKANEPYVSALRCGHKSQKDGCWGVVTRGGASPLMYNWLTLTSLEVLPAMPRVQCLNHVGAGDCFSAHLTLALAHGLPLEEAAAIAHSAGRVYVQCAHGRPPWLHEIRRDLDPTGGKVLSVIEAAGLRRATPGRVCFANGVFRLGPHAGHCWLLRHAKSLGDVLVVGIDDDASAALLRPGKAIWALAERMEMLAALESVDWIIPFSGGDPSDVIRALKPDVLVKGSEYEGQTVPGADLVPEVHFAPQSPFPRHWSQIEESLPDPSRRMV